MLSGGTGEPPWEMPANVLRSRVAASGCSSIARTTVGTPATTVTFSCSTNASASAASNLYWVMMHPLAAVTTQMPVTPAMWKNGNVQMAMARPAGGVAAPGGVDDAGDGAVVIDWMAPPMIVLVMLVMWLRWEPTAPLGNPVVPDV